MNLFGTLYVTNGTGIRLVKQTANVSRTMSNVEPQTGHSVNPWVMTIPSTGGEVMSLFSDFIRLATPEQKRAVYMEVLRQVEQMQRETIGRAA